MEEWNLKMGIKSGTGIQCTLGFAWGPGSCLDAGDVHVIMGKGGGLGSTRAADCQVY